MNTTTTEPTTATSWWSFMENVQYLAQVGHFFGALSVVLSIAIFFAHAGLWLAFGLGLIYALLKEFWFDIQFEKDTWSNSIMDFSFYVLGGGSAVGLFYLAVHYGRVIL
jgi:hypothetical protein